ncbi:MAG: CYTH domain-containing protein [Roseburia sp.]|nr:CYTH domain-containing protein [Roseburia sp.]
MEIERKYLVRQVPEHIEQYDHSEIEQGYLSTEPVLRIRKLDDQYVLTYKSKTGIETRADVCVNQETELALTKESYEHLKQKIDGILIEKTRYRIGYQEYTIELDLFHGNYEGMMLAEIEFDTVEESEKFVKPDWFGENVSGDRRYTNVFLATGAQKNLVQP